MSSYRRPNYARRRKKPPVLLYIAVAGAAMILVMSLVLALSGKKSDNVAAAPTFTPAPTAVPTPDATVEPSVEPTIEPTVEPMARIEEPTPEPTPEYIPKYAVTRPQPKYEGFLPVLKQGDTTEKIIAITVDDFFQFANARTIIDMALYVDGKITIFPIGKNVMREELMDTIRYAYDNGMEIENHTYHHSSLSRMNDYNMASEIFLQDCAVDYVLNLDYRSHFFRPMGGNGLLDERTHLYLSQIGYLGVAYWSLSGSDCDVDRLKTSLAPGMVYLFHTTDKDLEKLKKFIPYAVSNGYKLVTLNEMFGYPDNEAYPLTTPVTERVMEEIEPYALRYGTIKKGDNMYLVNMLQTRLIELGYLSGEVDGIYGSGTEAAVARFQQNNGLEATGIADAATQTAIHSQTAKRAATPEPAATATPVPDDAVEQEGQNE